MNSWQPRDPRLLGVEFLPASGSSEEFLYPDVYVLPRTMTADALVDEFVRNFSLHLTIDLHEGFTTKGLDLYQAVTLASIVQREAVVEEERAQIASVFYNRLRSDMKLDSDPTVQYALGFDPLQVTWWTNPLSLEDLQFNSPYNTYIYTGLPPGPMAKSLPERLTGNRISGGNTLLLLPRTLRQLRPARLFNHVRRTFAKRLPVVC